MCLSAICWLSVHLSVCCLSICLSVYLFVCLLPVYLCIYVSTDLADNSLSGVECTAHHPGSRGVADIVTVTMPLLSIYDLAVAISTRAGPAEDDPMLYKSGSKQVQAVCKGESGALNWAFWEVWENKHLASMPLPLAHFFQFFFLFFF